jgi:hypothetical protein
MLRGEPVVDREHPAAAVLGEEAAEAVVGLEVADHPAAAVVVDELWLWWTRRAQRHVEPRRQRASRARDRDLLDPCHRLRRPADDRHAFQVLGPRLLDTAPFDQRGLAAALRQLQEHVDVRGELLPVEPRRRPEEQPLRAWAQSAEPAD